MKTGGLYGDTELKHHREVMILVPAKPVITFLIISVGISFHPNSKCFTDAKNEYTCKIKELIFD